MTRLEMSLKQSSIEKYLSSSQSTQIGSSTVLASTCSAAVGEDDSQQLSNDEDPEQDRSSESQEEALTMHACSTDFVECLDLLLRPNQPRLKSFPPKQFGKNIR